SLDVMLFFFDETFRYEQGERHVLVACRFKARVQRLLNVLPERPAVWPHDHASAHRRIVRQLRFQNQLVVPLGKILGSCGKLFFSHAALYRSLVKNYASIERKSVTDAFSTV